MDIKLIASRQRPLNQYEDTQALECEKVIENPSKQALQAYLDNLLEDVFSQLPGS